jgi:hypothetical protein
MRSTFRVQHGGIRAAAYEAAEIRCGTPPSAGIT